MKTITLNTEELRLFLTNIEYLKYELQRIDVSDDCAGDTNEVVTAYDLITKTFTFKQLTEALD